MNEWMNAGWTQSCVPVRASYLWHHTESKLQLCHVPDNTEYDYAIKAYEIKYNC